MTTEDMNRLAKEMKLDGIEQTKPGFVFIEITDKARRLGNILEPKKQPIDLYSVGIVGLLCLDFWLVAILATFAWSRQ